MWELSLTLYTSDSKWVHRCFSVSGVVHQFGLCIDAIRQVGFTAVVIGGYADIYEDNKPAGRLAYEFVA